MIIVDAGHGGTKWVQKYKRNGYNLLIYKGIRHYENNAFFYKNDIIKIINIYLEVVADE